MPLDPSLDPQDAGGLAVCPLCGRSRAAECIVRPGLPRGRSGVLRCGFVTFLWSGRRRVLVARPRVAGFGNLLMDVLTVVHLARMLEARLILLRTPGLPNTALFKLRSDDVGLVGGGPGTRLAGSVGATVDGVARRVEAARSLRRRESPTDLDGKQLRKRHRMQLRTQRKATATTGWRAAVEAAQAKHLRRRREADYFGVSAAMRALWAHHPIAFHLPPKLEGELARLAAEVGLPPDARVVAMHVRESSWWPTRGQRERPKDEVRTVDVETYFPAVDLLVQEGFVVVRLGDRTMTPVARPGLVDLATSPLRTDLLELWCVLRSAFLVTTASGPYAYGWLAARPSLGTNVITQPIGAYPLRPGDRYIMKPIVDRATGRTLSLAEIATFEYMLRKTHAQRYGFVDNTADEILAAVGEMIENTRAPARYAPEQLAFRQRLVELLTRDDPRSERLRKRRPPKYVGAGLVGRAFAEHYFSLGREIPPLDGVTASDSTPASAGVTAAIVERSGEPEQRS